MDVAVDPVMLSTTGGKVVRGLAGIPLEGPVIFVSNHMMLGLDLVPLLSRFWLEQNIKLRTIAHPAFFERMMDGKIQDLPQFDVVRMTGGVPVSAKGLYRLLKSKSHVLLYPGGLREVLHRRVCPVYVLTNLDMNHHAFGIIGFIIHIRARNTDWFGQSNQSLCAQQQGLGPKLYLLALWGRMMSFK